MNGFGNDDVNTDPDLTARLGQGSADVHLDQSDNEYVQWLESRSMLYQAENLSDLIAGTHHQWQNTFGHPKPKDFLRAASVWFTSYPKSIITELGKSVLQALGTKELLEALHEIGIDGIHTGPMKRAGGISGRSYTPSVDGFFDRIELVVDPLFGTNDQYIEMTKIARQFNIAIIGDLVPGHTGKGADFRLAEMAYKNYEGLYTMVEIHPDDWGLLPPVPEGADSVNLSVETAQLLEDLGYIPGPLECIPFYDPGIKDSNWTASDVVTGVDGHRRRWVYLHLFKGGQPSFNWLDPTFGAQRIVMADAVQSLFVWGVTALRLDANPLIGIEGRPGLDKSWVEGHPVAVGGSNTIAMMIRKIGGFSFQELNLSLEDIKEFTKWGPDLSYDFYTRTPYFYAMATGDAGPRRLMLRLMQEQGIDTGTFVHALQNHDELMFGANHFAEHADEKFMVNGEEMLGKAIYETMFERTKEIVIGSKTPYIQEFSILGFCGTLAAFAAAALNVPDPYNMTPFQRCEVQRLHLLGAVYNAMQPGVFAVSGWDLVGALTVDEESLGPIMADRDCRWINRGAYDLMGMNPGATVSSSGMPKAVAIYGTLPEQLRDPDSFASEIKRMLQVRRESGLALSKLVSVPETDNHCVLVMFFQHPEDHRGIITALNFGREPVRDTVQFPELTGKSATTLYSTHGDEAKTIHISAKGEFELELDSVQGVVYMVE